MALSNVLSHNFLPSSIKNHKKFAEISKTKTLRVSCGATTSAKYRSISQDLSLISQPSAKFSMCYEQKVEEVRQLLMQNTLEEDQIQSLMFVDALQRLGIDNHFQDEIRTSLQKQYIETCCRFHKYYHSLHDVSLSFRLMREHGYHVSEDVFSTFKGKNGSFKGEIGHDIKGLMEMYEAAQISFEGENILEEAGKFSNQLLTDFLEYNKSNSKWSKIVDKRLRHPYHKGISRMAENNLGIDREGINEREKTIRELAKMDFDVAKSVYNEESLKISMWWKHLGLTSGLKLARNEPLKWYTGSMTILIDDFNLSDERVELTKSIAFIYLIDDIFDLYGTIDGLEIFTEAVKRWEYSAIESLPDYMKMCYKALLDTTNEIGYMIYKKHGYNPINSLKTTWASLCNAFLVEAKWFVSGNLPRADEYLENGKVSSGVHVVLVHLFYLLGLGGTNGSCEIHLNDTAPLISCVAAILRLWDDLGNAKDEHQDGKDGSYIECYTRDHHGSSVEQARIHVIDLIEREWKKLNKECFVLNHCSAVPFKNGSLNLARMVPIMYNYNDDQRLPVLENYVNRLLN